LPRVRLKGMTWDHRRAIEPLAALDRIFAAQHPDVAIEWQARPLSGFEFDPMERLAADHDLIIYDHPFCGRIAASGCLVDVAGIIDEAGGDDAYVGPSAASYRYGGGRWAVPVDAACQVAVYRPDLLRVLDVGVPVSWDDACTLAERCRGHGLSVAMGLKGVHSLMTLFSLCASLGTPLAQGAPVSANERSVAFEVLGMMRRLVALMPASVLDWNSIRLQDEMSGSDELVYCPAVYGFAAYAEADRERPLRFAAFAGCDREAPCRGSTIGGAGLGVSARLADDPDRLEAALAYARVAANGRIQRDVFASAHGQPAHMDAWLDADTDTRFGGFFGHTRQTLERSWIRPRYDGYLAFQAAAGGLVEDHLRGRLGATALIDRLRLLADSCGAGQAT